MPSQNIGRLQRVPLREVWKHEAQDFTQWLQNNVEVLSEALDLILVRKEDTAPRKKIGPQFKIKPFETWIA